MKITLKFLKEKNVCKEGISWWREHQLRSIDHTKLVDKLMKDDRFCWTNWLLTRVMTCDMCVKYSKWAAEYAAEYAADSAEYAAESAEYAKYAAECAEDAESTAGCAERAARYAGWAATADGAGFKKEIIDYGLKLIEEQEK